MYFVILAHHIMTHYVVTQLVTVDLRNDVVPSGTLLQTGSPQINYVHLYKCNVTNILFNDLIGSVLAGWLDADRV